MDLLTLLKTVVRRWYVAVPVLLVALVLAVATQATTPPQFQATGSVLLEEPTFDSSRLPSSLVSADGLVGQINDGEVIADALAPGTELVAQAVDRAHVEVTAMAPDAAAAEQAVNASLEWTRERVQELQEQAEVPDGERIQPTLESAFPVAEEEADGRFLASATIRLADPSSGLDNPLGTGERTSRMLEAVIMSDVGRARVAERTGGLVGYTLTVGDKESSILEIIAVAPDPANALAGFAIVRDELNEELDARQERAGVPPSWRIVVNDLAPPQSAGDISPPVNRSAIAILAAGILLAVGLTVAVDGAIMRRRAGAPTRTIRTTWTTPPHADDVETPTPGEDGPNGVTVVPGTPEPRGRATKPAGETKVGSGPGKR
jgi:hypothetical protein